MSRFVEKLNILNCINLKGNCVHYTYGLFRFAEKFNIQNYVNLMENCVHNMYGFPGFAKKKLNIQNCVNPTRVHYIYRMSEFVEKLNNPNCLNLT